MFDVSTVFTSGRTLYFIIVDGNNKIWTGNTFETLDNSHWLSYVNILTEDSPSGLYQGKFPVTIGAGIYTMVGYQQSGGSPDPTDTKVLIGGMDWNGSQEATSGLACTDMSFSTGTGVVGIEIRVGQTDISSGTSFQTGVKNG